MEPAEKQILPNKIFRDKIDWLLVGATVCVLPLLCLFSSDFWFRTDYWFFPILPIAFLAFALWRGRLSNHTEVHRATAASILAVSAGIVALCAASLVSPWLAILAWVLLIIGWMLTRLGELPWPYAIALVAPLMALLVFPLSDAHDPLHGFTSSVAASSSSVLDLLGVPQSLNQQFLELRNERLDIPAVCRGIGNPYLLFTLTVLLCLCYGKSLFQSLVTLASVPLWSWAGAVLIVVFSAWFAESYEKSILIGSRLFIVQSVVLLGCLIGVWLFLRAVVLLFSPFSAYSEGVGGIHKFYNSVVLWPEPDPLRKRKTKELKDEQTVHREALTMQRHIQYGTLAATALFVIAGAVSVFRLSQPRTSPELISSSPNWQSILKPTSNSAEVKRIVDPRILGADLLDMRLISFESFRTPGTACYHSTTIRSIYAGPSRQIQVTVTVPYRGFYPMERAVLSEGGELLSPRASFNVATSPKVAFNDTTYKDTLLGPSYLAYATWSVGGQAGLVDQKADSSFWHNLYSSIAYHAEVANVQLVVQGKIPADEAEKEELRQLLVAIAQKLQEAREPLPEPQQTPPDQHAH